MKTYKKVMSLVICFIMTLLLVSPASAASNDTSEMNLYAESVLPRYLSIEEDRDYGEVKLSQAYTIQGGIENVFMYFVFDDNEYIANLIVIKSGNTYTSNFGFDNQQFVTDALRDEKPIAIISVNNMLVFVSENEKHLLTAHDLSELDNISVSQGVQEKFETSTLQFATEGTSSQVNQITPRAVYNKRIYLPHVPNENVPGSSLSLCWGAAVAAVSNYSNSTSYDAVDIYNKVLNAGGGSLPFGGAGMVQLAFRQCNMIPTSDGSMTTLEVYNKLCEYTPIVVGLATSSGVGHTVVICYVSVSGITATYGYEDSNYSSIRYAEVTTAGITYYSGNYVYTVWSYSVYEA